MRNSRKSYSSGGFSLVEVMVAVLIISIGLLGIAKMQALALSSTGNARLRALASLEAASLASAIRANRTYWAASATAVGTDLVVKTSGATVASSSDGTLTTAANCAFGGSNAPCTTGSLAAYDVQQWATQINNLIPGVISTIDCTLPAVGTPVTCTIQINWTENEVAANTTATGTMAVPQYTLYVEP
jgi:type IV pilus assembly protein PilV